MSNYHVFLPSSFGVDPFFGEENVLKRIFANPLPWKLLNAALPEQSTKSFLPSLDITSDEKAYTIHAEIPGMSKDDVKLEVHEHTLVLSGEKKEERKDGKTSHVIERRYGSFERTMTLPDDADIDHITASNKDGVLTITIPRTAHKENRKAITINADA
ncbi:MAG: Hsp20/alpha crystallin family protein [Desulfovibrionaceae bacterium]|nr:Hsp20/alpha crystallin family protein [Desulfovibrionaceae bacterium]